MCVGQPHTTKAMPCERDLSTTHPAVPILSQREALPWKGNLLKAGVGEQVGTRRRVDLSSILSYPMAFLQYLWEMGLVIFFPWVLFALVVFSL